jgi:seryl-tRNA synthetase
MSELIEGTTTPDAEALETGTPAPKDEVTLLRSRASGLDAKVTELNKARADLQAERDALAAKLAEAQRGVVDKDEALRAQVAAKDAELATARREAALARKAAKFPEAFGVFGDEIAEMSDEKLAAAEARFQGEGVEAPTPRGINGAKTGAAGGAAAKTLTIEDQKARMAAAAIPWFGRKAK